MGISLSLFVIGAGGASLLHVFTPLRRGPRAEGVWRWCPRRPLNWMRAYAVFCLLSNLAFAIAIGTLFETQDSEIMVLMGGLAALLMLSGGFSRAAYIPAAMMSMVPLAMPLIVKLIAAEDRLSALVALGIAGFVVVLLAWVVRRHREMTSFAQAYLDVCAAKRDLDLAQEKVMACQQEVQAAETAQAEFLANVNHELRTPLNTILGFSDIIARQVWGPIGDSRYAEYAMNITASGRTLLSLIENLLNFSNLKARHTKAKPLAFSIAEELDELCARFAEEARDNGLDFTYERDEDLKVMAVEGSIGQIASNLISNAIKFSRFGGFVKVRIKQQDQGVILTVQDDGIGIMEDDVQRVTEPFIRAARADVSSRPGTGLGLPTAKTLAEINGGKLELVSKFGHGTIVTVSFVQPSGQEHASHAKARAA